MKNKADKKDLKILASESCFYKPDLDLLRIICLLDDDSFLVEDEDSGEQHDIKLEDVPSNASFYVLVEKKVAELELQPKQ